MKVVAPGVFESPYGLSVALADAAGLTMLDKDGYAETAITFASGVRASRVLTESGSFADGETVTIARIDGSTEVYTLKTALTPTPGEVLIGADTTAALANLVKAITGAGVPGTDYALGTEPCLDWEATSDATTMTVTAINYGDAYDVAVAAFAETGGSTSWGSSTLGVNSADYLQYHNNSGTAITAADAVEAQPFMRAGEVKVAPVAAQLTCKRYQGVIFDEDQDSSGDDTATSVFVRRHFTVITTHHPAAGDPKGVLYCGVLDDPTDVDAAGLYVEIPNLSHADDGDWLGGDYSVPDVDNIIANHWIELFSFYTAHRWVGEIKSYDYTDAGFGTNQGRVVFAVGGGIPATLATEFRTYASKIGYRIYESNIGRVAELGAQAKSDVTAAVPTVAGIADGVWDEDATGHQTQGTFGQAIGDPAADSNTIFKAVVTDATGATVGVDAAAILDDTGTAGVVVAAGSKTGYTLSAAGIQAIWDALTSALTTVGSIGKLLVDNVNAAITSRSSHSAADVWAAGTRTLTAGTNIALAKGTGVTGFNDLSAGDVRTAVGLAAANLDTQLGDLPTNAELATALAAADDAVLAAIAALDDLSSAQIQTAAEAAIAAQFGIVSGTVNDAAATVLGFTVTDSAGADIRLGALRFTSGALAGESRLVTWTGTTVAVVKPTSVPAGLTTIGPFSAAPANSVTYTFRPL